MLIMPFSKGFPEDSYCDIRGNNADRWLKERTDGTGAGIPYYEG